jgi:hypothetical protein
LSDEKQLSAIAPTRQARRPRNRAPILSKIYRLIQDKFAALVFPNPNQSSELRRSNQLVGRKSQNRLRVFAAAKSSFVSPSKRDQIAFALKPCVMILRVSSIKPTIPIVGVGKIPRPSVSL